MAPARYALPSRARAAPGGKQFDGARGVAMFSRRFVTRSRERKHFPGLKGRVLFAETLHLAIAAAA